VTSRAFEASLDGRRYYSSGDLFFLSKSAIGAEATAALPETGNRRPGNRVNLLTTANFQSTLVVAFHFSEVKRILILCPACGSNVEGDLCLGCPSCGAQAIGPPLAKAEHQLPSFGRAALAALGGFVMIAGFLGLLIAVLAQNKTLVLRLDSILAASEVAAWRTRWFALPLALAVLWSCARMVKSIKNEPERFIGLKTARVGFMAAIMATGMVGTLIGVTIPERWRHHRDAIEAGNYARGRTLSRALLEYRYQHGFIPGQDELVSELGKLPDPDGSIAEALKDLDPNGYKPTMLVAAASTKSKTQALRSSALRNGVTRVDQSLESLSFTNYDLRLAGEDKIFNNDDDLIVRDGLIMTVPEFKEYVSSRSPTP
jgi:hypothetical protein